MCKKKKVVFSPGQAIILYKYEEYNIGAAAKLAKNNVEALVLQTVFVVGKWFPQLGFMYLLEAHQVKPRGLNSPPLQRDRGEKSCSYPNATFFFFFSFLFFNCSVGGELTRTDCLSGAQPASEQVRFPA